MAITYFQDTISKLDSTLSAPGDGSALQVGQNNFFETKDYTLIAVVASIGTNVKVRLDGSIDGTNYAPIIAEQTILADGSHAYSVSGRPVKWVKPVFTSENGGSPTVTFHLAAL